MGDEVTVSHSTLQFTVDARLLRELGERLVGQPHIALAELIKNAYDADARRVEITFEADHIVISDDGHGMSEADFVGRWMRIGTGRKERAVRSPELKRPMTGSKGVGRLASQLLATELDLTTVGLRDPALEGWAKRQAAKPQQLHPPVKARVRWQDLKPVAKKGKMAGDVDLDQVPVAVSVGAPAPKLPLLSHCGTEIVLRGLTVDWDQQRFRSLAEQLWALQPPFDLEGDDGDAFKVTLKSPFTGIVEEFERQMRAVLDIWVARVSAELLPTTAKLGKPNESSFNLLRDLRLLPNDDTRPEDKLENIFGPEAPRKATSRLLRLEVDFSDGHRRRITVEIPRFALHGVQFEIRVFKLQSRQPKNVKVDDARDYLNRFGGVHIHDGSFRLPYYGPDQDWLHIEQDHAHRRSRSRLLPEVLQTKDGLYELPTNSRLYGSVNVSTSTEFAQAQKEGWEAQKILALQVTRDRLVDNVAFRQLKAIVRLAVDFYATELARSKLKTLKRRVPDQNPSTSVKKAQEILEKSRGEIPPAVYGALHSTLNSAVSEVKDLEESTKSHVALLGALATAGMTSLAYEHESQKQFVALSDVADRLDELASQVSPEASVTMHELAVDTRRVLQGAERLRRVFSPLLDEETRTSSAAVKARPLIKSVARDLTMLSRGTVVDADAVSAGLILPGTSYPAWSAIVQNVLINSFNAVLDKNRKQVFVDDGVSPSGRTWLRFQDTGDGVDIATAEQLFEPFVRSRPGSRERAALGLGGSGLGLTIVRMIAAELGCRVAFVEPEAGLGAAVRIDWKEAAG